MFERWAVNPAAQCRFLRFVPAAAATALAGHHVVLGTALLLAEQFAGLRELGVVGQGEPALAQLLEVLISPCLPTLSRFQAGTAASSGWRGPG